MRNTLSLVLVLVAACGRGEPVSPPERSAQTPPSVAAPAPKENRLVVHKAADVYRGPLKDLERKDRDPYRADPLEPLPPGPTPKSDECLTPIAGNQPQLTAILSIGTSGKAMFKDAKGFGWVLGAGDCLPGGKRILEVAPGAVKIGLGSREEAVSLHHGDIAVE
jgi:hypothetical protein